MKVGALLFRWCFEWLPTPNVANLVYFTTLLFAKSGIHLLVDFKNLFQKAELCRTFFSSQIEAFLQNARATNFFFGLLNLKKNQSFFENLARTPRSLLRARINP